MADPANWREYIAQRLATPFLGFFGERLFGMLAVYLNDTIGTGAIEARKAAWLSESTVPDDGLQYSGNERLMARYPGESTALYKARLQQAWNVWGIAGNEQSFISQLELFGLSNIEIKTNADWDWDGQPENWSRFWVVIHGHPWTLEGNWDDPGTWGDGGTWGITATPDEVNFVREVIRTFKAAHEVCLWIIVVLDETEWTTGPQPDGTWDDWRNRNTGAEYLDGTAPVVVIK